MAEFRVRQVVKLKIWQFNYPDGLRQGAPVQPTLRPLKYFALRRQSNLLKK
jgi:hypothetical protein